MEFPNTKLGLFDVTGFNPWSLLSLHRKGCDGLCEGKFCPRWKKWLVKEIAFVEGR